MPGCTGGQHSADSHMKAGSPSKAGSPTKTESPTKAGSDPAAYDDPVVEIGASEDEMGRFSAGETSIDSRTERDENRKSLVRAPPSPWTFFLRNQRCYGGQAEGKSGGRASILHR